MFRKVSLIPLVTVVFLSACANQDHLLNSRVTQTTTISSVSPTASTESSAVPTLVASPTLPLSSTDTPMVSPSPTLWYSEEEMQSGIVMDYGYTFGIAAPEGWVLDNEVGIEYGIWATFYPEGTNLYSAESNMYVDMLQKGLIKNQTITNVIESDIARLTAGIPGTVVNDLPAYETGDGKMTVVKEFQYGERHGAQAIAYLDEGKVVVTFVLTSKEGESFIENLGVFEKLVKSYFLVADNGTPLASSSSLTMPVPTATPTLHTPSPTITSAIVGDMLGNLVFAYEHLISISTPTNWFWDSSVDSVDAMIYPKDVGARAENHMYVNVVRKGTEETIADVIATDIAGFEKRFPQLVVSDLPSLWTADGKEAIIKHFSVPNYGFEATAFIDEKEIVTILVFYASTEDRLKTSFEQFEELVNSYWLVPQEIVTTVTP